MILLSLTFVEVLGDWSAASTKYQELTKNKSLIYVFKNASKVYPHCEEHSENYKTVNNPYPYYANCKMPWFIDACDNYTKNNKARSVN